MSIAAIHAPPARPQSVRRGPLTPVTTARVRTSRSTPAAYAFAVVSAVLMVFPTETCKPVSVIGYLVHLPEQSTPALVPARGQQCSAKGVNVATISPIQPGD